MDSENYRILNQDMLKLEKFDGSSYTRWADKVKFMLMVVKLYYVLDPSLPPIPEDPVPEPRKQPELQRIADLEKLRMIRKEEETLACGHIKNALSNRLYDLYSPMTCPRELWKALEFKYKSQEDGTNKYNVSQYLRFQMVDETPILEQVHELNKLKMLSIAIPEIFKAHNRERRDKPVMNANNVQKYKRVGRCHVCGETRHYARECKDRKSTTSTANSVEGIQHLVANLHMEEIDMISEASTRIVAARGGWYLDYGSTIHVCDSRSKFVEHGPVRNGKQVIVANNGRTDIVGMGTV
ncbi:uncharacterized protein LOC112525010 [Cynara cardunculus var. scolymus]|uniref:uncharacterized protein LOC112525010 n=1 Tax=Cynara cardunculus var. scolymus TaxID=59895 RepID=UPI000D626AC1|nr:uncharacterized protein LOC112525010 [Cynara cardunculus var. scolymus]